MFVGGLTIFAQDGSDMNYVKPSELNDSHIGRSMHIDFFRRSFASFDDPRRVDSIDIEIDGRKAKFVEHRVDDGFNNWFREQYLESVDRYDGTRLRVVSFELLKIRQNAIDVRAKLIYFDKNGSELSGKGFTTELSFEKKDIVELLFKASN